LHLGGGVEFWESYNEGKKKVEGNINMKASKVEQLYNFDEKFYSYADRHKDDFPRYINDTSGNPFNPLKDREG
jgi:hypothetical protein